MEITGKTLDDETLNSKLLMAEKLGLIKRKIMKINDEPYQIWKLLY